MVLDFGCGGGVGSSCLANILNKDGHLIPIKVADCSVIYNIVKFHYAYRSTGTDAKAVEPAGLTIES